MAVLNSSPKGSVEERWGVARRPGERVRPASAQRTLAQARTWGGRRKGAGRKKGPRPKVLHVARAKHDRSWPVHVTLRREKGLPSLREELLHNVVKGVVRETRREGFRIAHYSVQADHLHLIVEAESDQHLSSGLRSFAIRSARRLNRDGLRGRRGRVWADRHHRRELPTPTEVRHALVYVLANGTKHGAVRRGELDPCASGRWFTGWITPLPVPDEPSPTEPPSTWLLREGWSRVHPGFLFPSEVPKAARS